MKPFFIGPLQYAVATEVVTILKEVYRENTNQASNQAAAAFGGFGLARLAAADSAAAGSSRSTPWAGPSK